MLQVQAASCTSTAACTFSIPSLPTQLPETENLDFGYAFLFEI